MNRFPDINVVSKKFTINNELDKHMLVFSAFFNDFKNILIINNVLKKNYEQGVEGEISFHAGEMGGMMIFINKNMISIIYEFLKFLEKSKKFFRTSNEYKKIIKDMSKEHPAVYKYWIDFCDNVFDNQKYQDEKGIMYFLKSVRDGATFHYNKEDLSNNFNQKFKSYKKREDTPMYSFGKTTEKTRFFYADVAFLGSLDIDKSKFNVSVEDFIEIIDGLSNALIFILQYYLENYAKYKS